MSIGLAVAPLHCDFSRLIPTADAALLNQLAYALLESKVTVHSAHVATYGERAVDTFYVTDLIGDKIDSAARVKSLEKRLLEAAGSGSEEAVAA